MDLLLVVLTSLLDGIENDVSALIAAHEAGLAETRSVIVDYSTSLVRVDAPDSLPMFSGSWAMSGLRELHIQEAAVMFSADGTQNPNGGGVSRYALDDRAVRVMTAGRQGMDLDRMVRDGVTTNTLDYLSLKCAIVPRDPASSYFRAHYWFRRLVTPNQSLRQVIESGRLVSIESVGADSILEIEASDGVVGDHRIRVFLDRDHSYALRRTEFIVGTGESQYTNSIEIAEYGGKSNEWFPVKVESASHAGVITLTVKNLELNMPVHTDQLTLRFPEGARVDEPSSGLVHCWGVGDKPFRSMRPDEFAAVVRTMLASREGSHH